MDIRIDVEPAKHEIYRIRGALSKEKPGRKAGEPTKTYCKRVPVNIYGRIKPLADEFIDRLVTKLK